MRSVMEQGATLERLQSEIDRLGQLAEGLRREEEGLENRIKEAAAILQEVRRTVATEMAAGSPLAQLKSLRGQEGDAQLTLEALQARASAKNEESQHVQERLHRARHEAERHRAAVGELRTIVAHHQARVANAEGAVEEAMARLDNLRAGLGREQIALKNAEAQLAEAMG